MRARGRLTADLAALVGCAYVHLRRHANCPELADAERALVAVWLARVDREFPELPKSAGGAS